MSSIKICEAGREHLPALVKLLAELFTQEQDFSPDTDKQSRGLRIILDQPERGRIFIACADGEVIGMASVLFTISTAEGGLVGLLEDVIVTRPRRGTGIGRQLLEHVLQWCWRHGLRRVTLLTDHDNLSALDFYERIGFIRSSMTVMRCWPDKSD